ncbi:HEPN domain-containing protein (plasmid) [Sphingobium sp. SJ10-10]|uniref:HEPN domain-containing protein n=1 Tax=Sphingomonas sp. NS2 TaxID=908605 RepID=A0A0D4ZZF8_9SPHN|nr:MULTISPECIES: HEPN domain-containing protein [unclassified Sphingobium]AJW29333.1 hypothetical protein plasmid201_145 [Sphingomonas sp. NS2]AMK26506.1 hepn domain-containing protein [Sphingobium sp. TKS]MEC6699531.1 HEPN domain-containing protein [Sphingobium sp. SJ10-10]NML91934.1 HEPN domain-containing protein [Sphingobium sp. TB-6]
MMRGTGIDQLPRPVRQELRTVTALLFEAFAQTLKGRLSEQYRTGHIVKLILHGPPARIVPWHGGAGDPLPLWAIVNHPKLVRRKQDWHLVRDRLRRAWEFGEIARPVRLTVHSLQQVNSALAEGIPDFVTMASEGISLYEMEGFRFASPRLLPPSERHARAQVEFARWYKRASDFLTGAAFYRNEANNPMTALLLHQACEHLYQCVSWTLALHGRRTHALDELRELAEFHDVRLKAIWPGDSRFERRCFSLIRRAYVEARYVPTFAITDAELAWAMERVIQLRGLVGELCRERLAAMAPATLSRHHHCSAQGGQHVQL